MKNEMSLPRPISAELPKPASSYMLRLIQLKS